MNAKPTFPQPSSLSTTVAAALATFIAIGLLTAIAFLFQRDGRPLEQLVAAERACVRAPTFPNAKPACANGSQHVHPTLQANNQEFQKCYASIRLQIRRMRWLRTDCRRSLGRTHCTKQPPPLYHDSKGVRRQTRSAHPR